MPRESNTEEVGWAGQLAGRPAGPTPRGPVSRVGGKVASLAPDVNVTFSLSSMPTDES